MKQKIKMMNHKQQPSDDEIQGYMNFDRVLENRKIAMNASRVTTIFKWGIPILIGTLVIVGFIFTRNNASGTEESVAQKSIESRQSATAVLPPSDTTKSEDEPKAKTIEPNNAVSAPAPIVEKQADKAPENLNQSDVKEEGYMQAEPLNGYPNLYDYFNANLVYPASALKDSIQGVQTISFVINKNGKPEQIEVEESLGEAFETESIRLIENMPEWKPARLNGEPVPSRISIPLTFLIQNLKN